MNYKYLEDTSLNPQMSGVQGGTSLNNRLVFLNDNTQPVKCKYEEVWDYVNGACIDIDNYKE